MADAETKEKEEIELSENAQKILDLVSELKVLELANLVKAMEDKFGVSASAAMPAMAMAPAGGGDEGGAEEASSFKVMLKEIGDKKIQVIKAVRGMVQLGLKEAKQLVESAPVAIKEGLDKDEAEKLQGELEGAGAVVAVEPE